MGGTEFGHHVDVQLNGVSVGEVAWVGNGDQTFVAPLPPGLLEPADNSLALVTVFDTGAPYEFVMLRSVDVSYQRQPLAVGGEARFDLDAGRCVTVAGLGAGAEAWDVTDPARAVTGAGAASRGGVTVCSPRDGRAHTFEVFDTTALHTPGR